MIFKVIHLLEALSNVILYSCAAVDKISTDISRRAVPSAIAELLVTLTASNGKGNVTVWRPSVRPYVCLFRRHTHCDLPRGSMRRGQRTFRPNN